MEGNYKKYGEALTRTDRFHSLFFKDIPPPRVHQLTLTTGLLAASLFLSFATVHLGLKAGALLLGTIVGTPLIILCITHIQPGFLLIFLISSFIFLAKRFVDAPYGLIPELMITAGFFGILLKQKLFEAGKTLRNPVTVAVIIWVTYQFTQILNPNTTSLIGWLFGLRSIIILFFSYIVLSHIFKSLHFINTFTKLWLFIALLAALYGLYQEYFGLPAYDMAWVTSSEKLIGLNFIQGHWRKWSFLSDCTAFGMFMAIGGIFCFILLSGPYSTRKKIVLAISGLLMFLSMSYSGTRTAYAMVPAGFFIYGLMTLNCKRTILLGAVFTLLLTCILFVPTHNPTINRIRTAFMPSEDASMNVRAYNRARIQPYIYDHPFGGGLTTTGTDGIRFSRKHILAGFPPDSGYLKVALETGWIGLIIIFMLYGTVIITGIINYFKAKNPHIKIFYAAYIAIFFALTVANFTQVSIAQLPYGFILYAIYVLMPRLIKFEGETNERIA